MAQATEGTMAQRPQRMWMTDTRSLVMLLMLSVAASAIQQVAFRLDVLLTGGTGFYVGQVTIVATSLAASILFGPIGFILPVMTAAIGAFTSASPGAWYFIFDSIWIGLLVGWLAFKFRVREDLVKRTVLLGAFYSVFIVIPDYALLYVLLLSLPPGAGVVASLPYIPLTWLGIPFAIGLVKAIEAANLGV